FSFTQAAKLVFEERDELVERAVDCLINLGATGGGGEGLQAGGAGFGRTRFFVVAVVAAVFVWQIGFHPPGLRGGKAKAWIHVLRELGGEFFTGMNMVVRSHAHEHKQHSFSDQCGYPRGALQESTMT